MALFLYKPGAEAWWRNLVVSTSFCFLLSTTLEAQTTDVRNASIPSLKPAPPSNSSIKPKSPQPSIDNVARLVTGVTIPKAIARFEGTPSIGLRLTLRGDESTGDSLHYRWRQTSGTAVTLEDATAANARFVVPPGATSLGFVLVVGNSEGVDSCTINVPINFREPSKIAGLRADAGDDQAGYVGRQVTLNGVRSAPRNKLGFRWLQMAGPPIRLRIEDQYVFAFVPDEPGTYRFALVVATESEISEPDLVEVTVASSEPTIVSPPIKPPTAETLPVATPTGLSQVALKGIENVPEGKLKAGELAEIFDMLSLKMSVYESYAILFQEVSRRLDQVVPSDPATRSIWGERVFNPLTAELVEVMRGEGLDLRKPEGQTASLTDSQKTRLAEQFHRIAGGFRALGSLK